jgi:hypothetical protein
VDSEGAYSAENVLRLYPNPNKGNFSLSWGNETAAGNLELIVYNVNGQEAARRYLQLPIGVRELPVAFENLRPGVYLLSMKSDAIIQNVKFVVH